ncbi:uncharacterized protein LOC127839191 [Dreissena polymorpha]|uniref:Uncharacterized protein n=1 Tax=Dreissena polymorpha TaxID=45954 RepID=A0A9D4RY00_DREPO|nr:uncharacterized protein LOC127839191 [Dreissena polymorpha]KAH3885194.1 hypothetical protein DPMN_009186 [Dreissena polymorpha]
MAATQGYPKWLLDSKENISGSKEWGTFLHELHDAIQQQLTESHVQYFSDLSEAEKELFMQRATKAIENGSAYNNLYKKCSVLLDQNLNEEVSRQLLEEHPIGTKSDLVIDFAEDGALSLLTKWPDMKSKLCFCLNQPLPFKVRQLAWRLYLTNTKVRKQYIDLLNSDPRKAISQYDYEIDQKCAQLLNSEKTFSDLRGSQGVFFAMKAVLSYFHATMRTKQRLRDVDHMLVFPFVMVSAPNIPRKDPPTSRTVALLVEEFLTFQESRPGFVIDSGSETHEEEMRGFVDKVARLLQKYFPETPKLIAEKYVPSKDKIVATEAGSFAVLKDGLTILIRPLIRAMFVGYLRMETLLYVWDQYMIGLDTPGFNVEWLAIVTAIILGLLKDKFKECTTSVQLESMLKNEGPKLTIAQFQYEVKKHHYQDLWTMLQKDTKSAMPVLDPTQAMHPAWRHWFNDMIPPYTQPADRRTAREEREAERERLGQKLRDQAAANRERDQHARRKDEAELMRLTALERQRMEQEKALLEDQVMEERRKREEAERRFNEEIEKLRQEMALMQLRQPSRPPSVYSISSYISRILVPPPPTAASRLTMAPPPPVSAQRTPTPAATPTELFNEAMKCLIQKVAKTQNAIAHAEGADKANLDKKTEGFLHQNIRDIKQAQIELFGKKLEPGEFDRMEPEEQQDKSDKMMQLIQRWREERRAKEIGGK